MYIKVNIIIVEAHPTHGLKQVTEVLSPLTDSRCMCTNASMIYSYNRNCKYRTQ